MAKVTPSSPFESLSGKLSSTEHIVMRTRNGRIQAYAIRNPYTGPLAEGRKQAISAFAQAVKQCKVEMSDPDRLAYWQGRFTEYRKAANKSLARANTQFFDLPADAPSSAKEKHYTTLRGFIIAQLRKN
ncbi:MAG: hypothetical protein K6A36_07605 [Paludibacteraceae bacterium]|nr:hypothetical protein [Paludibacteraceae bacterium]